MRAAVANAPGIIPLERLDEAARLMERREALKVYVEVGTR